MVTIQVPGSKSITNRTLLIAALAHGKSTLTNVLDSDDTRYMQQALKALGVLLQKQGNTIMVSAGNSPRLRKSTRHIFCGNAGTAMRFLTAVLATQPFESTIDGDSRMRQRPIEDLLDALRQLGAQAYSLNNNGCPPIKVHGPLHGGICRLKGNVSSQFLSGLLMAVPLAERDITIIISGDLVSKPYVDMTIGVMERFGVPVHRNGYRTFMVRSGQRYTSQRMEIEGDASSASYFWGISLLTGEEIKVTNIPKNSLQADVHFAEALRRYRRSARLNCSAFPDSAMTLAVLCAFVKGTFHLTGLANLRVKECDRLHALATELRKIGTRVKELRDGLIIKSQPEKLHGATIETYNDHRMAMCFGMASVVLPGIKIKNPRCVNKTYPHFWNDLEKVKKHLLEKNIVLTGMRGSGKTELGKMLARKLKRKFIDLDEEIVRRARMAIAEIVERRGWRHFRKLEKGIVTKLSRLRRIVISTGGGTLMRRTNEKLLKQNGKVIFLKCKIPVLIKRLIGKTDRPSLTGQKNFLQELSEIYEKRKKRYEEVADAVVDVSGQTENRYRDILKKIASIIKIV